MNQHRLQKLLMAGEYDDFEDKVLVEGPFIEIDKRGDPCRQVYLGLTRDHFILAKDIILDYKKHPWIVYNADVDLDVDGLELVWFVPVCFLTLTRVPNETVISVESKTGRRRYFMMTNIGINSGRVKDQWCEWMHRLQYIEDDPYGYIRHLYKHMGLSFEVVDKKGTINPNSIGDAHHPATRRNTQRSSQWSVKATSSITHPTVREPAKSIVPANIQELFGINTNAETERIKTSPEKKQEKLPSIRERAIGLVPATIQELCGFNTNTESSESITSQEENQEKPPSSREGANSIVLANIQELFGVKTESSESITSKENKLETSQGVRGIRKMSNRKESTNSTGNVLSGKVVQIENWDDKEQSEESEKSKKKNGCCVFTQCFKRKKTTYKTPYK